MVTDMVFRILLVLKWNIKILDRLEIICLYSIRLKVVDKIAVTT